VQAVVEKGDRSLKREVPAMRKWLFGLAWAFILGVAAYDAYFAWRYAAVFDVWEINPLARFVAGQFGLGAILALKVLLLTFAAVVAVICHHSRRRVTTLLFTACVGAVHLALALNYLVGYLAVE
jgi:hypothetical protein